MHQIKGDVGGGVNISANLVCFPNELFLICVVGNVKKGVFMFGSKRFGREGCEWSRCQHL